MVHPGPRDGPLRVHRQRVPVCLPSYSADTCSEGSKRGERRRGGGTEDRGDAVLLLGVAAALSVAADEDDDGDDDGAADGRRRRYDDGVHVHRRGGLCADLAAL